MKLCDFEIGLDKRFFLIAGTCVIESEQMAMDTAGQLKEITSSLGIPFIYKSSYDKANRSSNKTFRGFGMEEGLRILDEVRRQVGVPILTDVHTEEQVKYVAAVVDVLQTPAFLCRQTDFITAVATCGKPVNIKKGQFLAPGDMKQVVQKVVGLVARLPEKQQLVLALHYQEDLSYREIAAVLDLTPGRISQLHTQAMIQIRAWLHPA